MKTVWDLKGYAMSRDYPKLWTLAREQSVVCAVDHMNSRDVCHTITQSGSDWISVGSRGISYVETDNLEDFERQANEANLEWLVPDTEFHLPTASRIVRDIRENAEAVGGFIHNHKDLSGPGDR